MKEPDQDHLTLKAAAELGSEPGPSSAQRHILFSRQRLRGLEGGGTVTGAGETEVGKVKSSGRIFPVVLRNRRGS